MEKIFDIIAYHLAKKVAWLIQHFPLGCSLAVARLLGFFVYCFDNRRFVAYANIKAAFPGRFTAPEIKRIVRSHYRHLSQTLIEVLYFPKMDKAYTDRFIHVENAAFYEQAVQSKSGAIFMTAHFGNWELAQIWSGIMGHPLSVLARAQKFNRLNFLLNQCRASHGAALIETNETGIRKLIRTLKGGGLVGALGDQGGGRDGLVVPLFGRKTTMPTGLMEIAQKTGAVILPSFIIRRRGPYHTMSFMPPLKLINTGNATADNIANSRLFLECLEEMAARFPDQWLWVYRRWKRSFTKRVLVLEDEKQGHAVQAKSIASEFLSLQQELSKGYEFQTVSVPVRFKNQLSKTLFFVLSFVFYRWAQGRSFFLKWFLSEQTFQRIEKAPADFIISCGAHLVPLALWLGRENLAKTIVSMKPPFPYNRCRFDLVILPKHDRSSFLKSDHITTTIAPNLIREEQLVQLRKEWGGRISLDGRATISVFVGGTTKRYRLDPARFGQWLKQLKKVAQDKNFNLLVTTSRRTGNSISDLLKNTLKDDSHCKLLIIANEKNMDGAINGMLALSDFVMVTEDSVSMISEAASAQKPVVVLRLGNGKLADKHERFLNVLRNENLICEANENLFSDVLESTRCMNPRRDFIAPERQRIREALKRLL